MKIIIFGTIYGSSKLYAEELSKRTGIEARSYDIESIYVSPGADDSHSVVSPTLILEIYA